MNDEVSPCCGTKFEDSYITDCCTVEMYTNTDICPACKEHADASGFICNECENWFENPEDQNDYDERVKENHYEEIADAIRKYGE
tara:strand:+ start:191 stop:445 length:255 start_codon:yes stop_codon:yes gene_type:complete